MTPPPDGDHGPSRLRGPESPRDGALGGVLTPLSAGPHGPGPAPPSLPTWAERVGLVLMGSLLLGMSLLPDEQLLRTKVLGIEALLAGTAAMMAVASIVTSKLIVSSRIILLIAALPLLMSLAWGLLGEVPSGTLYEDELARLAGLPLALFSAMTLGTARTARRTLLGLLLAGMAPVAAMAVGQHLAGLLELPIDRIERPPGTFGNPVFFAAVLVLLLPAALAAALFEDGVLRWIGALAAGFGLPALYATQGRAAWAGFAVALATGTVLLVPDRRARLALLGTLVVAAGALLAANREALERPSEHLLIWRDTWRMVQDHPWGVGPGQFHVAFPPYASAELLAAHPRADRIINDAHSEPLQILAELGWPGLLVALALLAGLLRATRNALRLLDVRDRPLGAGLAAGLAGWAVTSLASPDARFHVTPVAVGCVAGWLLAPSARPVRLGPGGRILAGALALAVLIPGAHRLQQRLALRDLALHAPELAPDRGTAAEVSLARELVSANPLDPEAHFRLGLAAASARDWSLAAKAFESCARLAPGHLGARRATALTQALAGRTDEAIPALRAWLAAQPDDGDVRYMLAYVLFSRGDVTGALHEVEELLARDPAHRLGLLLRERLRE